MNLYRVCIAASLLGAGNAEQQSLIEDDFERLLGAWEDRSHDRTCSDNYKCKKLELTGVRRSESDRGE